MNEMQVMYNKEKFFGLNTDLLTKKPLLVNRTQNIPHLAGQQVIFVSSVTTIKIHLDKCNINNGN